MFRVTAKRSSHLAYAFLRLRSSSGAICKPIARLGGLLLVAAVGTSACSTQNHDASAPSSSPQRSSATHTSASVVHGTDTDITFSADGVTVHGSLRRPTRPAGHPVPAALILAGSGPTDRNGNSSIAGAPQPNNLEQIADVLANQGIASFRYDKFGSGLTHTGHETPLQVSQQGFSIFVDEAAAATHLLAALPGIDPKRIALVGHSEGALVALTLVHRARIAQPAGLALLEPAPLPLLDILAGQLRTQLTIGLQTKQIDDTQAKALSEALADAVTSIRTTRTVPANLPPELTRIGLSGINAKALHDEDQLDPRQLIATLPAGTPVFITQSDADTQITSQQINKLAVAAHGTRLDEVHLTNTEHSLQATGTATLAPQFVTDFTKWTATTLAP